MLRHQTFKEGLSVVEPCDLLVVHGLVVDPCDGVCEDTAVAVLQFANGALGVIQGSTAIYPGLDAKLSIHGEKGTAIIETGNIRAWEFMDKKPGDDEMLQTYGGDTATGASDPTKFIDAEGHRLQIVDMIEAVREDRTPYVDGPEGRKAVEIITAVYKSAKEGGTVRLPL